MTPYTQRGLPKSLANDAWWLSAPADARRGPEPVRKSRVFYPVLGLIILIIAFDMAFWHGVGSLPLTLLTLVFAGVLALVFRPDRRAMITMGVIGVLSCLPMISFWQALSVLWWLAGLLAIVMVSVGAKARQWWSLVWRMPWAGVTGLITDMRPNTPVSQVGGRVSGFLRDWGLAIGVGLVFLILFMIANPLLDHAMSWIAEILDDIEIDLARPFLWIGGALLGAMALSAIYIKLPAVHVRTTPRRIGARPLVNALIVFNALFAFQLGSDILVLGLGTGLPDHLNYAEYAHRGAYPLVATALLAGLFMLLTRPHVADSNLLKILLLVWVGQNAVLLAFAAFRLSLYVDIFGLTYLRLHAGIWMGLVALGLGLVAWDLYRPQASGWVVRWSFRSAAGVLYLACFVNFGAIITNSNIARAVDGESIDWRYLCGLGVSNHGVIYQSWNTQIIPFSRGQLRHDFIDGWRDWDFRRGQIDRTIHQVLQEEAQVPS